ncbi:MAG: hypothetical protein BroJett025_03730 [Patescibacteria group bacterium]|nr:MAG: hypothetical protein BroJett025_03730 [Patescibacteria group bacterium]
MPRVTTIITSLFFLLLIFLGTLIGSKYLLAYQNSTQTSAYQPIHSEPSLTPTITELEEIITTTSQISPEGSMLLTLETKTGTYSTKYELFVAKEQEDKLLISSGQFDFETTMEIPFNTWSPDNKYIFLKQTNQNSQDFLVFRSSGEFIKDSQYINVTAAFKSAEIPYELHDVTGWAANSLLVVQTTNRQDDTKGPSYWFDVYSQKFIQLSTVF